MFKKLQSLLFEEDEEMEEEELQEAPVRKVVKPAMPEVPVTKPAMNRIDVAKEAPAVKKEPVFNAQPAVPHASPKPIVKEPVMPQEKPKALGIKVDEVKPAAPSKPSAPVKKSVPSKPKKKEEKASKSGVYEFKPVISPMFGVDEKDLDEQANIKLTHSVKEKDESSAIISPIYGSALESSYTKPVVEEVVEVHEEIKEEVKVADVKKEDDEIPAFSLDQILNGDRFDLDDEKEDDLEQTMEQMIDETVVFDSPVFTTEESVKKEKESKK